MKFGWMIAASVAAVLMNNAADAAYRYDLVITKSPGAASVQSPYNEMTGSLSFRSETLMRSNISILPSQIDSYSLVSSIPSLALTLDRLVFIYDTSLGSFEPNDLFDDIWLSYTLPNDKIYTYGNIYSFSNGVFSRPGSGTYSNVAKNGIRYATVTLTVTNLASVPEPGTWAMFIGGFGLIGGAMRSRKKVSVRFA
jgi:hypothetical protein